MNTKFSHLNDNELVLLCNQGENEAFGVLFLRYNDLVKKVLFFLSKDAVLAEDLSQDVFLKVLKKIQLDSIPYENRNTFGGWISKIASNTYISYLRSNKRKPEIHQKHISIYSNALEFPDTVLSQRYTTQTVRKLVNRLSEDQRAVTILRYLCGYTFEEIAFIIGCPKFTALSRFHYAKAHMRKSIEKYNLQFN